MATSREARALQLKVTLRRTKPPTWRRILIRDDATFWDLHVAIQDAMGWTDSHLHQFEAVRPNAQPVRIGVPSEDDLEEVECDWEVELGRFLPKAGASVDYVYDFGDWWDHVVVVEKVLAVDDEGYPRSLAGRRACPPEDCGGVFGYAHLVEVLADPEHKEHAELREWLEGEEFDPAGFDPAQVVFMDPQQSWAMHFQSG